jgi:transcription-repair coupling factor (superfamily II helicase)
MNLNTLLGFYQNDDRLKQLAAGISLPDPKLRVSLNHLRGSSVHFIAAAVWHLSDVNHVFVLNDKEEASYFQNDLENLTAALDIFLFPDSFKKREATGSSTAAISCCAQKPYLSWMIMRIRKCWLLILMR